MKMIPIIYKVYVDKNVEVCRKVGLSKFFFHGKVVETDENGIVIDDLKYGNYLIPFKDIVYIREMKDDEFNEIKKKFEK